MRRVNIGDHITLYFESALTIQYQIQEMLRIEKIFEKDAIREEFDAYTPLIPDRENLKATMMIEYVDEEVRRRELVKLNGIETKFGCSAEQVLLSMRLQTKIWNVVMEPKHLLYIFYDSILLKKLGTPC